MKFIEGFIRFAAVPAVCIVVASTAFAQETKTAKPIVVALDCPGPGCPKKTADMREEKTAGSTTKAEAKAQAKGKAKAKAKAKGKASAK